MQKQNEQMPHGLPQKCLSKKYLKCQKKVGGEGAVAAGQVQGGHGHGEIEEGQKEKNHIFLAELLLRYIRGFFLLVAARPRQPATVTAAATTATAATATRWVDRYVEDIHR